MMIGFQFRSAKEVLDLTAKEIANAIGVHYGTIVRLGFTKNLELIRCNAKTIFFLKKFFEAQGISFPNENSISIYTTTSPVPISNQLTRFQLIASRVASELTQQELSSYIKVSSSTISMLEKASNTEYIKSPKLNTIQLKNFFEHLGIVFFK